MLCGPVSFLFVSQFSFCHTPFNLDQQWRTADASYRLDQQLQRQLRPAMPSSTVARATSSTCPELSSSASASTGPDSSCRAPSESSASSHPWSFPPDRPRRQAQNPLAVPLRFFRSDIFIGAPVSCVTVNQLRDSFYSNIQFPLW